MAKSKLVKANQKIAEGVVSGYNKIESGVVGGYMKMQDGVVNAFTKMTDAFVDEFLTRDGESVEDDKKRMAAEQAARQTDDTHFTPSAPAPTIGQPDARDRSNSENSDGKD